MIDPVKSTSAYLPLHRWRFWLPLLGMIFVGIWASGVLEHSDRQIARSRQEEGILREAALLASRLESEVNSTFFLVTGLVSYIEIHPDLDQEDFMRIAKHLFEARPGLINVAAAPDLVVRYVYPRQGNEQVLGLDYRRSAKQREAAIRVAESGLPVIAGPVDLVQGGRAMIGRFPAFVRSPSGHSIFWGIISTPLDLGHLYAASGLFETASKMAVALRGKDGTGEDGAVFYGEGRVFEADPILFPVSLINSSWQIAALPLSGWITTAPHRWIIRAIVGLFVLLLALSLYLVILYIQRIEQQSAIECRAQEIKSRFLSNMSHEIRTPLHGINGLAQILHDSIENSEDRGLAQSIIQSSASLTNLLNDVLELSRMEAENAPLEPKSFPFEPFLEDILVPIRMECARKGLEFSLKILEPIGSVVSDSPSLRQVLWSLLSNATRFTETGRVECLVEVAKSEVSGRRQIQFTITDTGEGIAPGFIDSLFHEFEQEDNSDARRHGGAGLGLALAQRCIDRLGGRISVESEKGRGSRFVVIVPDMNN